MDTVVNKLLDMDKQARQILDEAKQYYDRTIEEIENEKQAITKLYNDKAHAHIEAVRTAETADAEDSIATIRARTTILCQGLDQIWNDHHEQWENELFARCTRR